MKFNLHSAWMWCAFLFLGMSTTSIAQSLPKASSQDLINNYLQEKREDLAKSGAVQYRIGDEIIEKGESLRRVYAQQTYQGIDLRDAILGLHVSANGKESVTDQFVTVQPNTTTPKIGAAEALRIAMDKNGGFPLVATLQEVPNAQKNAAQATIFDKGEIAAANMKARLIYINVSTVADQPIYRLAWETQAYSRDRQHYWLSYVDATHGKVLDNQDLVLHCNFGGAETDYSKHEQKCADHAHHERALAAALAIEQEMEAIKNQEVSIPAAENSFMSGIEMMPFTYLVLDMPADAPNDLSSGAPENPGNALAGSSGTPNGNDAFNDAVDQTLVTTEGDPVASELGWLTSGNTGTSSNTIGNNVYSFYDVTPGAPLGGAPTGACPPSNGTNEWNYTWDLSTEPGAGLPQAPSPYGATRNAAIVNLFYWNNLIHDVFYHYGFDEPGRNFQTQANPSAPAGGVHQDFVYAQAQDGGGTNNANMLTLQDGVAGQMQMYLWTGSVLQDVLSSPQITGPNIKGIQDGFTRTSTPALPVSGDMVLIESYTGVGATSVSPTDGCGYGSGVGAVSDNSGDVNGKIVFIDRGSCSFVEKVHGAEQSGAIAAVVMNNDQTNPDAAIAMGGTDATSNTLTIPSFMISFNDGVRVKAALDANNGVISGTLDPQGGAVVGRDGSFDNGVISHEYGHGISTRSSIRAVGGLGTLGGDEQGGEGWSDFWGLFMTLRSNDLLNPRAAASGSHPAGDLPTKGIGNYVRYLPEDGPGIRPRPYSTDMQNVNEYTYAGSMNGGFGINNGEITVPHGVGFVWCSMLYDVVQSFVNQYGMNDDIGGVTGSTTTGLLAQINSDPANNIALAPQLGGNVMANFLIVQGIKLQASRGSFIDQRNAILEADQLFFDGAHQCIIWEGFSKRGLGFSADGGTNARGDETEAFDVPPTCGGNNSVVSIEKTTTSPQHDNGTALTYTLKVTNVSTLTATDVVVRDNMISGMSFSSASDNGAVNGGVVEWNIGSLAGNETRELTVTYDINSANESCTYFFDDMETAATTSNWATSGTASPITIGGVTSALPPLAWELSEELPFSGAKHWFVPDPDNMSQQWLEMTNSVEVTANPTKFVFTHLVGTEAGFDSGVVEMSTDNGVTYTKVPTEAFDQEAYNSTVAVTDNTVQNGDAYSGSTGGYVRSIIDLKKAGASEGDNVLIRFSFNSDVLTPAAGWYVDDVVVADNPTFLTNTATVSASNSIVTNSAETSVLINGSNCVASDALAVQFIDFNVQAATDNIILNWETANEVNADRFVVERRTKADVAFAEIGFVTANNQTSNNYEFVDTDVRGGVDYFYRLRQLDNDAKSVFSPIRQARIEGNGEYEVTLVPNPTTGAVTLNWTKDLPSNYEVEVIAANGQLVHTQQINNGDALRLDLSNFASNLYFVKINTEVGTIVKKLMLKK